MEFHDKVRIFFFYFRHLEIPHIFFFDIITQEWVPQICAFKLQIYYFKTVLINLLSCTVIL